MKLLSYIEQKLLSITIFSEKKSVSMEVLSICQLQQENQSKTPNIES